MGKLNEQTWNDSVLSRASLITEGNNFMRTYDLNNGEILKVVKKEEELGSAVQYWQLDDFILSLMKKVKLSRDIKDSSIVLPKTAYYDKDGKLVGYTTRKINDGNIDDYLMKVDSLEIYEKVFSILINKVKLLNAEGIIFPDLGNTTNILFNPKNGSIHFIDYDGLQIEDVEAFSIGAVLQSSRNPMIYSSKYSSGNLFNSNLDKLTLLVLYIYYTTRTNIMFTLDSSLTFMQLMNECLEGQGVLTPDITMFKKLFEELGITDTELSELVKRVFDQTETNIYPDYAIKSLTLTHNLESLSDGTRRFIKK